ncbi:AgmX/PglI C-terminal domain-containing protein [bacterium]|nr:AgmX/PglI C-terminal domain-containing protein [bacterium]
MKRFAGWSILLFLLGFFINDVSAQGTLDVFCPAPAVFGGPRSEEEVSLRIQQKIDYFRNCYGNHIKKNDTLNFKVRVRFVIKPAGNVDSISVIQKGISNIGFISCLKSILAQIRFQSVTYAEGESVVEQSFIFKII